MKASPLALATILAASLAGPLLPTARADVINIDNAEVARLTAKGVPIIDIRTAGEWKSSGVIPGAKLLTFFDERGNANAAQWLASAKGIAKPDQPVILVCRSGNRSRAASQFLSEQAGYKTVYNVDHGMNGWMAEKRAIVPPVPAMTCAPGLPC